MVSKCCHWLTCFIGLLNRAQFAAELKAAALKQLERLGWPLHHNGVKGHSDHDSILVDMVPKGITGNPQVPHVDFPCSYNVDELLRVAIVALEAFSLYVYPFSHTLMRSMMEEHGPDFQTGSTEEIDARIAQSISMQIPIRLDVQPGEIIIFDGYLVHAGTEGMCGESRLRLHLYLQSLQPNVSVMSDNHISSFPLQRLHNNMWSKKLASKFARVI